VYLSSAWQVEETKGQFQPGNTGTVSTWKHRDSFNLEAQGQFNLKIQGGFNLENLGALFNLETHRLLLETKWSLFILSSSFIISI